MEWLRLSLGAAQIACMKFHHQHSLLLIYEHHWLRSNACQSGLILVTLFLYCASAVRWVAVSHYNACFIRSIQLILQLATFHCQENNPTETDEISDQNTKLEILIKIREYVYQISSKIKRWVTIGGTNRMLINTNSDKYVQFALRTGQ